MAINALAAFNALCQLASECVAERTQYITIIVQHGSDSEMRLGRQSRILFIEAGGSDLIQKVAKFTVIGIGNVCRNCDGYIIKCFYVDW